MNGTLRRRFRDVRGSLNLEATLLIAFLVLTASTTLLFLGGSIACLYQREAGTVAGPGSFYTEAPVLTSSPSPLPPFSGTAHWASGPSGPFEVRRYRTPAAAGEVLGDISTWPVIATVASGTFAPGLDLQEGDRVVVVADAVRCGSGLFTAVATVVTPGPEGGGDGNAGDAWYAGLFYAQNADYTGTKMYVAGYKGTGAPVWSRQLVVPGGTEAFAGSNGLAVSDDTLYVTLQDTGTWNEGVYAYRGWKTAATLADPVEILTADDPLLDTNGDPINIDYGNMGVTRDGKTLVFTSDYDTVLVDVQTKKVTRIDLPGDGNGGLGDVTGRPAVGLDGHLYAMTDPGHFYRLDGIGSPRILWSKDDYGYDGGSKELEGVDAAGNAYFSDTDLGTVTRVTPAGVATELVPSGITDTKLLAFSPAGSPVYVTRTSGTTPRLNALRDLSGSAALADPLFTEPVLGRDQVSSMSLRTVPGNIDMADIPGGVIVRTADPQPPQGWGTPQGFLAAGGTGSDQLLTSDDGGVTWGGHGMPFGSDGGTNEVIWAGSQFLAVGGNGSYGEALATFSDAPGVAATPRGNPFGRFDRGYGIAWNGQAQGSGSVVVAVGSGDTNNAGSNTVATSSDGGNTWTGRGNPFGNPATHPFDHGQGTSVATNGGRWVAVGFGSVNEVVTSDDGGNTWTGRGRPFGGPWGGVSVAFGGSQWMAVGDNAAETRIFTSPDGVTWADRGNPFSGVGAAPESIRWYASVRGSSTWVAVGSSGSSSYLATSADGISWTVTHPSRHVDDLVWNGTSWVAVGGRIGATQDFTAWADRGAFAMRSVAIR